MTRKAEQSGARARGAGPLCTANVGSISGGTADASAGTMNDLRVLRAPSQIVWLLLLVVGLFGCDTRQKQDSAGPPDAARSLHLGAYTTPREAYGQSILPAFRVQFRERTKKDVEFRESYLGSGAQARAIIAGFEADVAALSLEPDIEKLREAGLIKHDWKAGQYGGMITRSIVVIGVREGNPKNIKTWQDLARADVEC